MQKKWVERHLLLERGGQIVSVCLDTSNVIEQSQEMAMIRKYGITASKTRYRRRHFILLETAWNSALPSLHAPGMQPRPSPPLRIEVELEPHTSDAMAGVCLCVVPPGCSGGLPFSRARRRRSTRAERHVAARASVPNPRKASTPSTPSTTNAKPKRKASPRKKKKKQAPSDRAASDETRRKLMEELEKVSKASRGAVIRRNILSQRVPGGDAAASRTTTTTTATDSNNADSDVVLFPGGPGRPPKGAVDLLSKEEMFNQLSLVRKQMSKRLSQTNLYVRHLQMEVMRRDEEIAAHSDRVVEIEAEFQHVLASVHELRQAFHGEHEHDFRMDRLRILEACVVDLATKLSDEASELRYVTKKTVPVSWAGVAQDVKLMGSFDGWAEGEQLSPNDVTGAFTEFSGELLLRPGVYEVKFLVDGRWRLAPEWPTSGSDPVKSNNILVIE